MKLVSILRSTAFLALLFFVGSCSKEIDEVENQKTNEQLAVSGSEIPIPISAESAAIGMGYTIYKTIEFDKVPWVGGGDADVYSRPGRFTRITINVDNLRVASDGSGVTIHILYSITESLSNYTHLQINTDYFIPCPKKIVAVLPHNNFVMNNYDYYGKDWSWHYMYGTGCLANPAVFKFDGAENDNNGNAQLKLYIQVPVLVEN